MKEEQLLPAVVEDREEVVVDREYQITLKDRTVPLEEEL
jgi:hypothetical protein